MRRYAELHCKTNFSFLQGASHADELVARAAELGYHALAITDQNSLASVVRAHAAAKPAGLKLLIGAEITPEDAPPVLLYATNLAGYRNLSRLITRGRRAAKKGECRLVLADIAEHAEHLLAAVLSHGPRPDHRSAGSRDEENDTFPVFLQVARTRQARVKHATNAAVQYDVTNYADIFRGRCYLAAAVHHGPDDEATLDRLAQLARKLRLPLLATNDVHYHDPARRPLHD